jgi:hypothetical protein
VSRDGQLANAFTAARINIEFRQFNAPADVYALLEVPKVQQFLRLFDPAAWELYRDDRAQQILCVGIILQ